MWFSPTRNMALSRSQGDEELDLFLVTKNKKGMVGQIFPHARIRPHQILDPNLLLVQQEMTMKYIHENINLIYYC